jgi:hypothetical protein
MCFLTCFSSEPFFERFIDVRKELEQLIQHSDQARSRKAGVLTLRSCDACDNDMSSSPTSRVTIRLVKTYGKLSTPNLGIIQ